MGIDHGNLQFYTPTIATSSIPPFSALDRFLTGQSHYMQLQTQSSDQKETGFTDLSLPYEDQYGFSNSWLLPELHGCISNVTSHEIMSHGYNNSHEQHDNGVSSDAKKNIQGRSPSNLVKRKWTEDEDRTLVKLVKENGMKKWASIAQKLDGRTAKQCRERWQNHLRPDIKKDSWSEVEEKIFVEAHEKLGNRWSEIARRIPGRTENAVKNHWNAAKRRRKLEKGRKKRGSENLPKPSSLLQDYIMKNNLHGGSMISQEKTIPETSISEVIRLMPLEPWEDEYSSPLITDTVYDEELVFMLNLFNGTHHQPLGLQRPPPSLFSLENRDLTMARGGFGEVTSDCVHRHQCYEYRDGYYLEEGEASQSVDEDEQMTKGYSYNDDSEIGVKDMDLIELVSSSQPRKEI